MQIKKFLAEHDYIVRVYSTNEGCIARFPNSKLKKKDYQKTTDINYKIKTTDPTGVQVEGDLFYAPAYSLRLLVASDIINKMTKLHLHQSLISYYKHKQEVSELTDILASPIGMADQKKEAFLIGLLSKAIEDNFSLVYDDVAFTSEHNVGIGYRILRGFF